MKRSMIAGVLTVFLISSFAGILFAAENMGTTETAGGKLQTGTGAVTVQTALEQTISEVEGPEIKKPPQVVPLPRPEAMASRAAAGNWSAQTGPLTTGPSTTHQEPPFYVNPVSQTIRQVRDVIHGFRNPAQESRAVGMGQAGSQGPTGGSATDSTTR